MKKWIALIAGVMVQVVLGGVYAWSAFAKMLNEKYSISKSDTGLIFGVSIAAFTLTMIPATKLLNRFGPRVTASLGAILFAAGYAIASFSGGNYIIMLIALGVVTGAGIGLGYSAPLVVGMKWFPKNRGLITGIAVGGFGAGAIILKAFIAYLANEHNLDVFQIFFYVAVTMGPIALLGAAGLFKPAKKDQPAESKIESLQTSPIRHHIISPAFMLFCVGLFASTFAGLLVIGNLESLATNLGLDAASIGKSISIFAIGNAAGRIIWGQVHDKIGSRKTILFSLLSLAIPMGLLLVAQNSTQYLWLFFFVGAGFGSSFIAYASSVVDYFSVDLFAKLYPICFLSYGLAALIGPKVGGAIADATGSYTPAIITSAAIVFAGFAVLAFFLPAPSQKNIAK